MSKDHYKIRHVSETSLDDRLKWIMGNLARELKITKKSLRQAIGIIKSDRLTEDVPVRGRQVRTTFVRGFHAFVKKSHKKRRKILAPHPKAQMIFRAIKDFIVAQKHPHEKAFGFVKQRNVQMAVKTLLGNEHFFSFDIADAFPSITNKMVEEALLRLELAEEFIQPLAWLMTCEYGGQRRLPQGASSSPAALNLVYLPMCRKINEICEKHGIEWFVYADDFNFAAREIEPDTKKALIEIPSKYGFAVKPQKTKDNHGKTIPHLLGLTIVEGKIHIKRKMKKKYRRILFMAAISDSYSHQQVRGVAMVIRQTYGKEKNWPGWLRKPWQKYQAELRRRKRRKSHEKAS